MGAWGQPLQRALTFLTGLVECMCFAGLVFGWASLVFVLKSDGYFSSLCSNHTDSNGTQHTVDCSAQDEQLSLVFTIASFMNNFMTLPNGFIFDRFGTAVARLLAISFHTSATLMVAFSSAVSSVILFPALSLLAVGGILLLLTNMQVGNLFGSRRSTIITLYNGAFDSSSAVFLIVKVLYEKGVSLRSSFLFLSCCSVLHFLRTFLLMPRKHIPYPLPEDYTYGVHTCGTNTHMITTGRASCGRSSSYRVEKTEKGNVQEESTTCQPEAKLQEQDSEPKKVCLDCINPSLSALSLDEPSFRSCVFSFFFLWHLTWISVMQLRHYLFIGTLNPMLTRLAQNDPTLVSRYTNAFAFTQLCGVLCAPWNGMIMDRHKRAPKSGTQGEGQPADSPAPGRAVCSPEAVFSIFTTAGRPEREADLHSAVLSLALTALQCLLFSLCASIPLLPLQYLTFILQVVNRSFLYGGNAAFIAVAFPPGHFGKLYGLVMSLSAIVSLLQYPCFALVKGYLQGDPLYVNVALIGLSMLAFIHPINVYLHCRREARKRKQHQAE
ncbi:S43A3 protein, partial [Atractosteus spatula]|nr:S43A3 protein [Atractosteus spatula]